MSTQTEVFISNISSAVQTIDAPSHVKKSNGDTSGRPSQKCRSHVIGSHDRHPTINNVNRFQSQQDFELDVIETSSKERLLQLPRKKGRNRGENKNLRRNKNDGKEVQSKISLQASSEGHPSNGKVSCNSENILLKSSHVSNKIPQGFSDQFSATKDLKRKLCETSQNGFKEVANSETAPQRKTRHQRMVSTSDLAAEQSSSAISGRSNHLGDNLKYGTWSSQSSTASTNTCHVFVNFNSVPTFDLASIQHNSSTVPHHHFLPEVSSLLNGNSHLIGPAPPLPEDVPRGCSKRNQGSLPDSPLAMENEESHSVVERGMTASGEFYPDQFESTSNYFCFPHPSTSCDKFSVLKDEIRLQQMSSHLYERSNFLSDRNRCSSTSTRAHDKYWLIPTHLFPISGLPCSLMMLLLWIELAFCQSINLLLPILLLSKWLV